MILHLQHRFKIRKDMKNHLLDLKDKLILSKRSLIESVFNVLKNSMNLEHFRHRSITNYVILMK